MCIPYYKLSLKYWVLAVTIKDKFNPNCDRMSPKNMSPGDLSNPLYLMKVPMMMSWMAMMMGQAMRKQSLSMSCSMSTLLHQRIITKDGWGLLRKSNHYRLCRKLMCGLKCSRIGMANMIPMKPAPSATQAFLCAFYVQLYSFSITKSLSRFLIYHTSYHIYTKIEQITCSTNHSTKLRSKGILLFFSRKTINTQLYSFMGWTIWMSPMSMIWNRF